MNGSTSDAPSPSPFQELGDFTTVNRRTLLLAGGAALIGIAAAFVAAALLGLIGLFTNLFYYGRFSWSFASPAGNQLGYLALVVPILGGLIVGVMARYGSERIRGHGIPEALESILVNKSRIQPKVMVLKPVSAAISIGSGGPFGAEGPIIMTGGSLGSVFGQALHLSAAERKVLLVAGAAGGMAATFNSPMAAVLLAVELLLFEWRPRSLIPVGVASATATVVRWEILGSAALFPLSALAPPSAGLLGCAVLIGLSAGLLATVLTWAVYGFEDLYRKLPIHWMWWPALGGTFIGVGGLLDPRVLGVGYNTLGLVLASGLAFSALATLLLVKGFVWTASLGSGTSGGVLAPLLMMGASTGALIGALLPMGSVSLWALVGMGAILGGAMRVPLTGVIFALELTHDINVLFPLFLACLCAEAVTIITLRRSILTEKIARRQVHAAREYAVDPLEIIPVREIMHTEVIPAPAQAHVREVALLAPERTSQHVLYTLIDEGGELRGVTTKSEVATYLSNGGDPEMAVIHLSRAPTPVLYPAQPVRLAVERMAQLDSLFLPIADPSDPHQLIGFVSREDVFRARVLAMQEESERDRVIKVSWPALRLDQGPWSRRPRRTAKRRSPPASKGPDSSK